MTTAISSPAAQDKRSLTNKELNSFLAKVHSKQEAVAKAMPDYWHCWEEMANVVEQKVSGQGRDREAAADFQTRSKQPVQGAFQG